MEVDEELEYGIPTSLKYICLQYLVTHDEIFSSKDTGGFYRLKEGLVLPAEICENIIEVRAKEKMGFDDKFMHMFKDTSTTRLKRVYLPKSSITDKTVEWIMNHNPLEIDLSGCTRLREDTIDYVNSNGKQLTALLLGKVGPSLAKGLVITYKQRGSEILNCPNMRAFSLQKLHYQDVSNEVIHGLLASFSKLTFLDLSSCHIDIGLAAQSFNTLKHLVSLVLFDVKLEKDLYPAFTAIGLLKTLRSLDISRSEKPPIYYDSPKEMLKYLLGMLPKLSVLDISGTNLAGSLPPETGKETMLVESCSIPGANGRSFQFLGLQTCANDACKRDNIPAKQVTGDANEDQLVFSMQTYMERHEMLAHPMGELFTLFRYSICRNPKPVLKAILEAMEKHKFVKDVQISGSATLFYLVKNTDHYSLNSKEKMNIISAILEAMETFITDATVLRNGCFTLSHFKIPQDMMFAYSRMVKVLLAMMNQEDQEYFLQRITVYLLNSMACQVDGYEKKTMGDLGAISSMLCTISRKLERSECNEVMVVAWSTMWNVTDETPSNCEKFLNGNGMVLFQRCLGTFPSEEELLRNMMGTLGNVAEVKYLRPQLMESSYVSVFGELLASKSDGIEVSYNACGILAHMISDGEKAWTIPTPDRATISEKMHEAIKEWDITSKRSINYRSFEPIIRLLPPENGHAAQHWAVWALCNLTQVYPEKYCELLEKDKGIPLLEVLARTSIPSIAGLAKRVIERCQNYDPNAVDMADVNGPVDAVV